MFKGLCVARRRRCSFRPALVAALAAAAMTLTPIVHDASAQRGGFDRWLAPAISTSDVDAMDDLLVLDADQRTLLDGFYEQYLAEHEEAAGKLRAYVEELRAEFERTRDRQLWSDFRDTRREYREHVNTLRDQFFADAELILMPEQAERWPRVERRQRRSQNLDEGFLTGAELDLIDTYRLFQQSLTDADPAIDTEATAEIARLLERYEMEVDRAIVDRQQLLEEAEDNDTENSNEVLERRRGFDLTIRDANMRYARQVEQALPDALQQEFRDEVLRRVLPRTARTSPALRAVRTAIELDGLSNEQLDRLTQLEQRIERDRRALAERLLAAELEWDADRPIESFRRRGWRRRGGDNDEPQKLQEAREAMRDLGRQTASQLQTLLTPEQFAELELDPETGRRVPRVEF